MFERPSTKTYLHVALRDNEYKLGYLAFMRLIGTVYFKKNSEFDTVSPASYFSQFNDHTTVEEQHSSWLQEIRQTIWYRTKFENEMIASDEALLLLHWQRSCCNLHMWSQADRNDMELLPMTSFGWCSDEDLLTMKWDTEFNICAIRESGRPHKRLHMCHRLHHKPLWV